MSDGSDKRSSDDDSDKAINLKLYGNPTDNLYLSASYMHNGDGMKSAIEFGGSHFEPVTDSAAGSSSSDKVNADLYELTAKLDFSIADMPAYFSLTGGWASQEDDDSQFDRDLSWVTVEPYLQLSNEFYTVIRYSSIGTYEDSEGFHFDGKTFADGNASFGYDAESFQRLGIGLGWQPNPRTRMKLEVGKDWFELVEASTREKDSNRNFIGVEVAVGM